MKPLQRATITPLTRQQVRAHRKTHAEFGLTPEQSQTMIDECGQDECWRNSKYIVMVRGRGTGLVHLSIRRNDREPVRDWRHMQQIKNELVGPENEAVELFPAESRLVDTANSFHLWCAEDPDFRFPLGWDQGRIVQSDTGLTGAKQRPHRRKEQS